MCSCLFFDVSLYGALPSSDECVLCLCLHMHCSEGAREHALLTQAQHTCLHACTLGCTLRSKVATCCVACTVVCIDCRAVLLVLLLVLALEVLALVRQHVLMLVL